MKIDASNKMKIGSKKQKQEDQEILKTLEEVVIPEVKTQKQKANNNKKKRENPEEVVNFKMVIALSIIGVGLAMVGAFYAGSMADGAADATNSEF